MLGVSSAPPQAFLQGLESLGYVSGRNVIIEYRSAGLTSGKFSELAAELAQMEVDVIYAPSTPAIFAAKQATGKIPIIMTSVGDPVEGKIIQSLARPGGNITGIAAHVDLLSGKMLELLADSVSRAGRVGVLFSSRASNYSTGLKITESSARSLKLQLQNHEVQKASDLSETFSLLVKARVGAAMLLPSILFSSNERVIAKLALAHGIPVIFWRTSFADVGGFMAYGPSLNEMSRRAGIMVGKILNGANPAELPVEQPTRFDFVLNLKTAKALGVTVPPDILVEATRVIE